MSFTFIAQAIPAVLLVEHRRFSDERGHFSELFRAELFASHGLPPLVQENMSRSRRGVLRGLHYQLAAAAQGKLVQCTRGRIFDVAVDLRHGSPTYGRHLSVELEDEERRLLWIPPGFAHGFQVLSEVADVQYKMTSYYSPAHERCIAWNDPELAIPWPLASPLLSPKDAAAPRFSVAEHDFY